MHSNLLFPNFEMQYFQPESYSDLIMSDFPEPPNKFGMDKRFFQVKEQIKDATRQTIFQVIRLQNFVVISFSKTLNYVRYRNYQNFCEHQK